VTNKEAATIAGMTLEDAREWQDAFLHLQGRAGSPASAVPLARMLRRGKDIPSAIAYTLADFLDDPEGKHCQTALKVDKNVRWHSKQRSAVNRLSKRRIGQSILSDIEAGLPTDQAVMKRTRERSFSRTFLYECLEEAELHSLWLTLRRPKP
jgi:hypothetical protein